MAWTRLFQVLCTTKHDTSLRTEWLVSLYRLGASHLESIQWVARIIRRIPNERQGPPRAQHLSGRARNASIDVTVRHPANRGEEMILDRPAVGVRIIPKPPIQEHINDWFGTAWFDRESLQPLKFEVFKEDEFIEFSAFEAAMRGEIPADDFTFTRVTALFDTEKNGMRFPSRIVIDRSRHQVKGPPDEREASDRTEFRVTQRYSNYRFFNVRTQQEVRELVFGQTRREGGR